MKRSGQSFANRFKVCHTLSTSKDQKVAQVADTFRGRNMYSDTLQWTQKLDSRCNGRSVYFE